MKSVLSWTAIAVLAVFFFGPAHTQAWFGSKYTQLTPDKGVLFIPVKDVSDGQAHYFSARSDKGIDVKFFV
ncbi:MAG: hypothetical protein K9K21_08950, partial [Desulfotignum sp.]|nr:hypothetical protein [Desulfotignum sp.]